MGYALAWDPALVNPLLVSVFERRILPARLCALIEREGAYFNHETSVRADSREWHDPLVEDCKKN
jgi:hypothetical protein